MFKLRLSKGKLTEKLFISELKKHKITFEKYGREFTIKNKVIHNFLSFDSSPTAAAVRYQPDFLVLNKSLCFVELKSSLYLEYFSYKNYIRIEESGINIIIVFYYNESFYFAAPSDIKFIRQDTINRKMYHYKTGLYIPLIDGIWIYPEALTTEEQNKLKKFTGGSGLKYAEIDKSSLKKLILCSE